MDSSISDAGGVSPKTKHMVVVEEIAKYFAHEFMFDEVSFNATMSHVITIRLLFHVASWCFIVLIPYLPSYQLQCLDAYINSHGNFIQPVSLNEIPSWK